MNGQLTIAMVFFTLMRGIQGDGQKPSTEQASVFMGSELSCPNQCEILFPDGSCNMDLKCLLKNLFSSNIIANSPLSTTNTEGYESENDRSEMLLSSTSTVCHGKCLFEDLEGKCRLDLICLLNRDVEGTLRFLRYTNVDAETAILLSLSVSSKYSSTTLSGSSKACHEHSQPAVLESSLKKREKKDGKREKDLRMQHQKGERGKENDLRGQPDGFRLADPPVKICPRRCEVRNTDGKCVLDFDCVRNDP